MKSPPIGKSQIIQLLFSLNWPTHSRVTKKKEDAEPEKKPTKAQMKIHLRVRRLVFFRFISARNYSAAIAVNSISTKYSGATDLLTS